MSLRGQNYLSLDTGAVGCGKTYIACALGNAACRQFRSVRYIRLPELLEELEIAHASANFKKTVAAYKKVDLLILDEWLLQRLKGKEAFDLLEIIEARTERGSVIFCTQYDTGDWYERITQSGKDGSTISDVNHSQDSGHEKRKMNVSLPGFIE